MSGKTSEDGPLVPLWRGWTSERRTAGQWLVAWWAPRWAHPLVAQLAGQWLDTSLGSQKAILTGSSSV